MIRHYMPGMLALYFSIVLFEPADKKEFLFPSQQTLYYKSGAPYQRIESGFCTGPLILRSINCDPNFRGAPYNYAQFSSLTNWSTSAVDAGTFSSPPSGDVSTYLWSFDISSYQDMSTVDGDDATGLSAAEALEVVRRYYIANGSLPAYLLVDSDGILGNDIVIYNFVASGEPH